MFMMARQRIAHYPFKDQKIRPILELMASIYALKELQVDNQHLYETGFFRAGSGDLLTESYNSQLRLLRPHLIPIVELSDASVARETSWNISTIGNKYGDIVELQLEVAQKSRLNTGSPPPYYEKLMKPII